MSTFFQRLMNIVFHFNILKTMKYFWIIILLHPPPLPCLLGTCFKESRNVDDLFAQSILVCNSRKLEINAQPIRTSREIKY